MPRNVIFCIPDLSHRGNFFQVKIESDHISPHLAIKNWRSYSCCYVEGIHSTPVSIFEARNMARRALDMLVDTQTHPVLKTITQTHAYVLGHPPTYRELCLSEWLNETEFHPYHNSQTYLDSVNDNNPSPNNDMQICQIEIESDIFFGRECIRNQFMPMYYTIEFAKCESQEDASRLTREASKNFTEDLLPDEIKRTVEVTHNAELSSVPNDDKGSDL